MALRMCVATTHSGPPKVLRPTPRVLGFWSILVTGRRSAQAERSGLSVSALSTWHAGAQVRRKEGGDATGRCSTSLAQALWAQNSKMLQIFAESLALPSYMLLLHSRARVAQSPIPGIFALMFGVAHCGSKLGLSGDAPGRVPETSSPYRAHMSQAFRGRGVHAY